jgi:hypothetical protein
MISYPKGERTFPPRPGTQSVVILDISDKAHPKPLFVGRYDPPATVGFTHTAMPLFSRRLLVVSAESVYDRCLDAPKRIWVWDLRDERHPVPLAPVPYPANAADLCHRGGRFGAHNIWENRPGSLAFHSDRLVVGSFFAGGVRVYDISDPARPREVAYDVPPPLPRGHRRGRSRSTTSTGTTAG